MIRVIVRRARLEELADLTELCLRSKAHWGYDQDFIDSCREELTLTAAQLKSSDIRVAESCGKPVGVVQLVVEDTQAELEKLFIEPDVIGQGFGGILMRWALGWAGALGANSLKVTADPGAQAFYERFGATQIGEEPSGSIKGRVLPVLQLDLRGE